MHECSKSKMRMTFVAAEKLNFSPGEKDEKRRSSEIIILNAVRHTLSYIKFDWIDE